MVDKGDQYMTFRCAKELRNDYEVYANFYKAKIDGLSNDYILCRNVADIVRRPYTTNDKIDEYIVMMNPGKCKPNDYKSVDIEDLSIVSSNLEFKHSKDDHAQRVVMNLMDCQKWNHVRIFNLSDICNPKSGEHIENLKIIKTDKHSIFSKKRIEEFKKLTKDDVPFILSWGRNAEEKNLAVMALERLADKRKIGIPFDDEQIFYRYIKPWKKSEQEKMVNKLSELLCLLNN